MAIVIVAGALAWQAAARELRGEHTDDRRLIVVRSIETPRQPEHDALDRRLREHALELGDEVA